MVQNIPNLIILHLIRVTVERSFDLERWYLLVLSEDDIDHQTSNGKENAYTGQDGVHDEESTIDKHELLVFWNPI